jgi:membrane protein required for colicin V production
MGSLSGLDWFFIVVVSFSVLISFWRGLVREVLSLAVWVSAFVGSFYAYKPLSNFLGHLIHHQTVRVALSFLIIFIAIFIFGTLLTYLFIRLIDKTGLRGLDRFLGLGFGLARGVLVVVIVLMLGRLSALIDEDYWKHSVLVKHLAPLAQKIQALLPHSVVEEMKKL